MEQEEFIDGVSSLKSRDNAEATLKDGEAGDQRQQVSGLNFANFNQDYSCISVGYENGFRIFNCDPFNQCYEQVDGSIGIVEMLFSSSLLAIVGTGEQPSPSPRRLKIINTKRHTTICELTFPTSILSIRMNRERLVVLLEEIIYIYDITNMRLLHTIEIPSNPTGLIALSIDVRNNYLAYPSPQKTSLANAAANNINGTTTAMHPAADITGLNGQHPNSLNVPGPHDNENLQNVRNGDVIIFDCKSLQPITVIDAHKTRLAAMAFSHDGTLIATASDKGTIVRVFSVETGVKLYQFRRGTYNTKIFSLAFSPSNMFLIASSATGTVHVFRLGEEEAKNTIIKSKGSSGWLKPGVKNQTDKNIEAARQSELDKLMKSRQAKLDMLEEDDELLDIPKEDADPDVNGDGGDAHDILQRYKKLQLHSDSEDEIDSSMEDNDAGIVNEGDEEEDEEEVEVEEYENVDSLPPLLSEQGSSQSVTSASTATTKAQPIVDTNRRSVARMLRRTSQSLGRKAAEKMGTYLPPKFSSILEPNRHFASLKVPNSVDHMSIVGITESVIESSEPSNIHEELVEQEDNSSVQSTNSGLSSMSRNSRNGRLNLVSRQKLVQIFVISADGMFYNYILDSIRGGDCVLSSQRSLTD